jgi:hypothetical protein
MRRIPKTPSRKFVVAVMPFCRRGHTLDWNFMDWCSSKYREAQKSAVESLAILLGQ